MGIKLEFSAPTTPQQNGVPERKNKMIQEMANVMLTSKNMAKRSWAEAVEAVNTTCYITNRVYLRPGTTKTAYEIWNDRKPNINYFRVLGSPCYVLRDRKNIGKFDAKSNEAIFLGYSNKRTLIMEESIDVIIGDKETIQSELHMDHQPSQKEVPKDEGAIEKSQDESKDEIEKLPKRLKENRLTKGHSLIDIIGNPQDGVKTYKQVENLISHMCITSKIGPRVVKEALDDPDWIVAM